MQQSATLFVPLRDGDEAPLWRALAKNGEPLEVRDIRLVEGGLALRMTGTELRAGEDTELQFEDEDASISASHRLVLSGGVPTLADVVAITAWLRDRARIVDIALVRALGGADAIGAVQWLLSEPGFEREQLAELHLNRALDLNLLAQVPQIAAPGLLLMDMDSTAIQIECIDEIAKLAGVGEKVAEVTELTMQGKLDFSASLRARVATLTGHPLALLEQVAAAIPLTDGLEQLIAALHRRGWVVGIVSGGFTYFTDRLQRRLGLDFTRANTLEIVDGRLSGRVDGPVIDAVAKAETLIAWAQQRGLELSQTVAAGDGANDLKMLAKAGLGVAFHAKPVVRAQAAANISHGGIEAIYYLLADTSDLL